MGTIRSYPLKTDFDDQTITNVTEIQLKTIVSDDDTSVSLGLGTDVGDNLVVATDALVVLGETAKRGYVGVGTATPSSKLEVRGTTGERTLTTGAAVSPTQIDLSYDASNKVTLGAGSSGELVLWADDCMTHLRSDDTCTYLQIQNSTTGYYGSSSNGLSIAQNGNNAFIKNTEPGSLQLHSGTTSGANLALEINSSGEITVLGSDTPATDEVLSWDGSKAVWAAAAGGGAITMQTAANVDVTATVDTMVIVASDTAPVTVTLPAVAGNAGKFVIVKARHGATNTVTVDGAVAETIDGAASQSLTSAMASIEMICDGAEWWVR
jgi:hypothetical protein